MIPIRRRAILPPGHWWVAHKRTGFLVVTVSVVVPPGSRLERELVKCAVRAWRNHQRRGLILLPAPAAGEGVSWLVRQFRRPAMAAGATVAGLALAVTWTQIPHTTPHPPATADAAPAAPATPAPKRSTAPQQPVRPIPRRPVPVSLRPSQPHVAADVSTSRVHVDPARLPIRLPVRVPPVHVIPPRLPDPPVHVTPPPSMQVGSCRLVTLELKVVRVCV